MEPVRLKGGYAWAVLLDADAAGGAGKLRLRPDVEVCEDVQGVWLRGVRDDEALRKDLRMLAGARRFRVEPDGAIVPEGRLLPAGRLPAGAWRPLREWLVLQTSRPRQGGLPPPPMELTMLRSSREQPPSALLAAFPAWRRWAQTAPAARLAGLRFAVSEEGAALITGCPLPPIAGKRLVLREGVAVPCGLEWHPAVPGDALREAAGIAPGDLLLLDEDGRAQLVPAAGLVAATRDAVRRSAARYGP